MTLPFVRHTVQLIGEVDGHAAGPLMMNVIGNVVLNEKLAAQHSTVSD